MDSPRIILIPGLATPASHFANAVNLLDCDVELLDRPGLGSKTGQERPHAHLADSIDWLNEVVGDSTVMLIAHSTGCLVAAGCANDKPSQVLSLGVFEPFVIWDDQRHAEFSFGADRVAEMASCLIRGDYHGGFRTFIDWLLEPGAWDAFPAWTQELFLEQLPGVWADAIGIGLFCIEHPFLLEDLSVPTVVGVSPQSPEEIRSVAHKWASEIPRATRCDVQGGHLAYFKNPNGFSDFIRQTIQAGTAT